MILKFQSFDDVQGFVRRLEMDRHDLRDHIRVSQLNPVVTIDDLDVEEARWFREYVGGSAEVFEDVQFEPFVSDQN